MACIWPVRSSHPRCLLKYILSQLLKCTQNNLHLQWGMQQARVHVSPARGARLDVGVDDAAVAQVVQRGEQLRRVRAHRADVEPDAAPVLLGQLAQIDVLRAAAAAQKPYITLAGPIWPVLLGHLAQVDVLRAAAVAQKPHIP